MPDLDLIKQVEQAAPDRRRRFAKRRFSNSVGRAGAGVTSTARGVFDQFLPLRSTGDKTWPSRQRALD
jgi:hypothetical protein